MEQGNSEGQGIENVSQKPSKGFIGPLELAYDEIPFYRKRWFVIVLFLLFVPAVIVIGFSGDVYALRNNKVYKYANHTIGKVGVFLLIIGIIKGIIAIL